MKLISVILVAGLILWTVTFSSHAEEKLMIYQITVRGNAWTNEGIILRELEFSLGESLDKKEYLQKLLKSKNNIEKLEIFSGVSFKQEIQDNRVKLTIDVEEKPNLEVAPGGIYYLDNEALRARGFLYIKDNNFFGLAQKGEVQGFFGRDLGVWISWREPKVLFSSWELGVESIYLRGAEEGRVDRLGGSFKVGVPLFGGIKAFTGYRYENIGIDKDDFSTISSFKPAFKWGSSQRPSPKERGWGEVAFEGELALGSLGGSEDFSKLRVDIKGFRDFFLKIVGATYLSFGLGSGMPHYELFPTQVRGYDPDYKKSDAFFLLSTELRIPIPIYTSVQIVPFFDVELPGDEGMFSTENTLMGGGFGLRWFNPYQNPFRIDFGFGNGVKLYAGLGGSF